MEDNVHYNVTDKMPINSNPPKAPACSTGGIADKAIKFFARSIGRIAVKKYRAMKGHRFETTLLTQPTVCSCCSKLIFGPVGQKCKLCNLVSHRDCLDSIECRCLIGQASENKPTHQFKPKYFPTLTFCDHCGVIILGVFEPQGLECSCECKMKVHFNCEQLVCQPCHRNKAREDASFLNSCQQLLLKDNEYSLFLNSFQQLFLKDRSQDVSLVDTFQSRWQSFMKDGSQERRNWSRICIKDFQLIRLLGTGTFSKVYLARLRGHEFAIKVIKKTNPAVSGDPESALTEMRTLNYGRYHPFLAIAHCCFQSEDRLFFVMEYVIGRSLLYHLNESRKFTEDRVRFYASEIVLAVSYLHEQGVVYRDLKLENIILEKQGHCKLLDFGMSKEIHKSGMRTRTFCGTPSYISPEVIRESDYGFSVDWWALGVLMFEMLIGCSPFGDDFDDHDELYRKIVGQEILRFPEFVSYEARSILDGLLTKDPQNRLGCQLLEDGERAIFQHPFFLFETDDGKRIYRWDDLLKKKIPPPYVPTLQELDHYDESESDPTRINLEEFDKIAQKELDKIPQREFDGFSFYSESFNSRIMNHEDTVPLV